MNYPATPVDPPPAATIAERLKAAGVAHRDAQEVATKAAARFRAIVLEAVDEIGLPQKTVAQLAGVSRARIHAIIVTEYRRP